MLYVDRPDHGLPHADLDPLMIGTDFTTDTTPYAAQVTAGPSGGQLQGGQQPIAREHSMAWPEPGYDWTVAAPIQIFFVVVTVLAVPCFIWRLAIRLGWLKGRTPPSRDLAAAFGTSGKSAITAVPEPALRFPD